MLSTIEDNKKSLDDAQQKALERSQDTYINKNDNIYKTKLKKSSDKY